MKNKGKKIIKMQLRHLIYGPDRDSYTYFRNFLEVAHQLQGWHYWYLLRTSYQSADCLYIYREEIKEAFLKNEPEKNTLMGPYERRYLQSLGSTIKLYQGMTIAEAKSGDYGVSWTLSLKKAEDFAYAYARVHGAPDERTVVSLDVPAEDIIAYFAGPERKIIYIPNPQDNEV